MKCHLCGEDLGEGDEYDLLKSHLYDCNSKEGQEHRNTVNNSQGHSDYCDCEYCQ